MVGSYNHAKLKFIMDGKFTYEVPIEIVVTNDVCIVE